ncbi:hypothetical protein CXB51_004849 [Gossypium anomalum]|uniref:RNase H type-1 domain-containing protein n=1 Tax=Gossypium anomalum TaxID=47600 RepID=A0A8J6D9D9_9ROSI|nr:hypothetical protein CXB51_004849 [Gossypium anomalum]
MHVVVHKFQADLLELDVINQWLPGRLIDIERWRPPDPLFIKLTVGLIFISVQVLLLEITQHARTFAFRCQGDSLTVIRKLLSPQPDASIMGPYIRDIIAMVARLCECRFLQFSHITNQVANQLVSTGQLRCLSLFKR